jgi:hypothetical protein
LFLTKKRAKEQDGARNHAVKARLSFQKVLTTDAQQQSPTGKITTNSKVCRCEFFFAEISSLHTLLAHKNTEAMKYGVVLPA